VEQLDPRASGYQVVSIIPISASSEKQDQWSQPLSACADETENEIGHTWIINSNDFFQPRLHQK
jgi:hypothetical protein